MPSQFTPLKNGCLCKLFKFWTSSEAATAMPELGCCLCYNPARAMSSAPPVSPTYRPPGHPVDVRQILQRHRPYLIAISFALGGLIAIEAWGIAQFFPVRADSTLFIP